MSGTDGFADMLRAIAGARRAQARQSQLIRDVLGRMVTRDEFNDAIKSVADMLSALDEAIERSTEHLVTHLAALAERFPSP